MNEVERETNDPEPLVSVILTVYKRTQFLKEAIQGVIAQTFDSYELIVADDSASKEIETVCNEFKSPKIKYAPNHKTLGVALNVKQAIDQSNGKYIAILNDDDAWEPEFLKTLVGSLEKHPECSLAFSDHWIISEEGNTLVEVSHENTKTYKRDLLPVGKIGNLAELVLKNNSVPLAMASVFKKHAIDSDRIVSEVRGAYDFWISCLLAENRKPAFYCPERLTRYRIHGEMETNRKSPDIGKDISWIYSTILNSNMFPEYSAHVRSLYANSIYRLGRNHLNFGLRKQAREYFLSSIKERHNIKAFVFLFLTFLPVLKKSY